MNDALHDNDDAAIDRLVDGELSADERRRLLASLEERPDGWRRCALAFLEAQSWRGEMRRIVDDDATPAATIALADRRPRARHAGAWLSAAAGLLVAFGLGWQFAGGGGGAGEAGNLIVDAPSTAQEPANEPRLPDADAVTLVVQDHNGVPRRMQVPLVEGSRLGAQFVDAPRWAAPAVREKLAQQGLDLQARRRYAPLFFEQQDRIVPMIVPVDDAVVTPVSLPIY